MELVGIDFKKIGYHAQRNREKINNFDSELEMIKKKTQIDL